MAPLLKLLEATEGRSAELDGQSAALLEQLADIERQVKDKRSEKTIAAMDAVKELLKRKEGLAQESRVLDAAATHVRLALAKLQKAQAASIANWKDLHEESKQLSAFAKEKMSSDQKALASLRKSCGGATITVEGDKLSFVGSASAVTALEAALQSIESEFSLEVEVEPVLLAILNSHGNVKRVEEKYGVTLSQSGSSSITVTGHTEGARKAEKELKFLCTGMADVICSRSTISPAKVQAKEVEAETGALIEVARGGPGGSGIIQIRGDAVSVKEAEAQMRAWLDEREGSYSVFIDAQKTMAKMDDGKLQQFSSDLVQFGQKFRIMALVSANKIELRGAADGSDWEAPARRELQMILDFYVPPPAPKAKTKPKSKSAEEDTWGTIAPEADFELGHKW